MASPSNAPSIHYRKLTRDDLAVAHELSQVVKWPHRLQDWQLVETLGTGFVAELDGQVIGTALCWHHGEHFASLGMVIVSPENQSCGIGRKLMTLIVEAIGDDKNICLFATPSGQPLYESFGFKATGEVHQHQATIDRIDMSALPDSDNIRPLNQDDTASLTALAEMACGLGRAAALDEILKQAEGVVLEHQGDISGFALIRKFGRGHAIGPVIATSDEQAQALIQHCLKAEENNFVRIDMPKSSGLSPWLEKIGLPQVDTVVEMVRGTAPERAAAIHQYALISQALG